MDAKLISHRVQRVSFGFPEKEASVEQIRRQKILSGELVGRFSPKHYPNVFLDRRLRSQLFR